MSCSISSRSSGYRAHFDLQDRKRTRGASESSPFHKRYSRANLRFPDAQTSSVCDRDAYFLQLSKIIVPLNWFRSERLRSRRSAEPVWSRHSEKKSKPNKKPGDERRANPSISLGAFSARPLGRMCSKLAFFLPGVRNQPHLWISRQARSSADSRATQGSTNFQPV